MAVSEPVTPAVSPPVSGPPAPSISLSDFLPKTGNLSPACSEIYNYDITECTGADFEGSRVCSRTCALALVALTPLVQSACAEAEISSEDNVIAIFLTDEDPVGRLCPPVGGGEGLTFTDETDEEDEVPALSPTTVTRTRTIAAEAETETGAGADPEEEEEEEGEEGENVPLDEEDIDEAIEEVADDFDNDAENADGDDGDGGDEDDEDAEADADEEEEEDGDGDNSAASRPLIHAGLVSALVVTGLSAVALLF